MQVLEARQIQQAQHRILNLQTATAMAAMALIAATWRLWWGASSLPAVPLSGALVNWPIQIDQLLATMLAACLAAIVFEELRGRLLGSPRANDGSTAPDNSESLDVRRTSASPRRRGLWLAVAFLLLGLWLGNQHRIQAWAFQFFLLALLYAAFGARDIRRCASWLFASVYVHSAWSKFDHSFQSTLGPDFVSVALGLAGRTVEPDQVKHLAWILPACELLVGVMLLVPWRPVRKPAVFMAMFLHVQLLAVLGPWGLNHHWGVLLWNSFFLVAVPILFWPAPPDWPAASPAEEGARQTRLSRQADSGRLSSPFVRGAVYAVVTMACLLPTTQRWGYWDHWPSWGLYSPSNPRVLMWVSRAESGRLPARLQPLLEETDETLWLRVPLGAWSLEAVNAPIYPQDRFQLGVALEMARRHGLRARHPIRTSVPSRLVHRPACDGIRHLR